MDRSIEQISDEWLVLSAQDGSRASLEILLQRWHRPLWARAARLIGDRNAAEDIVQETLVAIVKRLVQLEDPARFRAWAFQIVAHKSRDWIRKQVRERNRDSTAAKEADAEAEPTVQSEPVDQMRDALSRLPSRHREILRLFYHEGFSITEIAEAELIPIGTVKSRLFKAREAAKNTYLKLNES
ncbi:MAG: RNA polymerase sigma factor [Verrucomicrobiota bacterium]